MRMTLREMIQSIGPGYHGSKNEEFLRTEINRAYGRIATRFHWSELEMSLGDTMTDGITMTAGQAYVALPADAAVISKIVDKTNDLVFNLKDGAQSLADNVTLLTDNGLVLNYTQITRATKRPLSIDDNIQVITNSASDTSVPVRIKGRRSDVEAIDRETIDTHASTPNVTAVDSTLSYEKGWSIHQITVPEGINDFIRIREKTTAANILAEVTEHQRSPEYKIAIFEGPPDAANELAIYYKRMVEPLVDDEDRMLIPVEDAVIEFVRAELRRSDREYQGALAHTSLGSAAVTDIRSERQFQQGNATQVRPDNLRRPERRAY